MSLAIARPADGLTVRRALGRGRDLEARARDRAGALAGLDHPAVLTPAQIEVDAQGTVSVVQPRLDGMDLAELAGRRRPLALEECIWLGVRLGEALEAMHAAGIVHGDVAPANVLVGQDRAVLVDTMGALLTGERGTPGFRAPERLDGATAPGDVCSLGLLLRWCASADAAARIEAWTAPMVVRDPGSRPPAQVVVRALNRCAPAAPVVMPMMADVVSATRARVAERTERIAAGRSWRARRWALRTAGAVAVAACAVGIVVAVPRAVDAALPAPQPSVLTDAGAAPVREASQPPADEDGAADAAIAITQARFDALAAGSGEQLDAIPANGAVAQDMARLAARLQGGGLRYEGLTVGEISVRGVELADARARVSVDYVVGAHRVIDGATTWDQGAYEQRIVMELEWQDGWAVSAVSARE